MPQLSSGVSATRPHETGECPTPALPQLSGDTRPVALCASAQLWALGRVILSVASMPNAWLGFSHIPGYRACPFGPLAVRRVWQCRGRPPAYDTLCLYVFQVANCST